MPEQICYVHRADEGKSLGVVHQAILPENGHTHTLDLGGQTPLTGRLLINGAPLADGRIQLTGENAIFGLVKAYAQTAPDGSFKFLGIPPGNRTLYYALPGRGNDWAHVREITVLPEGNDLGDINHLAGRLVVRLETPTEIAPRDLRLLLQEYDPIWPHGRRAGVVVTPQPGDPFVIERVPPGKYELICNRPGQLQVRQFVEITSAMLQQEITLTLPVGTASLSGRVDEQLRDARTRFSLNVWSRDSRLLGRIVSRGDGTYRLENIPAGEYLIRDKDTRSAPVLMEVSLDKGKQRKLDFTPQNFAPPNVPTGFLTTQIFTSEGIPLPCEVRLESPAGEILPRSEQYGRVTFVEPPGHYTLRVSQPGFETIRRAVELKPVDSEGRPAEGYSRLRIRLKEQTQD